MPRKENNNRRFPGVRGRRPDKAIGTEQEPGRRATAKARQAEARSPEKQLAHLDACGFVAAKERAKIAARIEAAKAPKPKGSDDTKERRHGKSKS